MTRRLQKYLPTDRSKLRYWLIVSGLVLADLTPGTFASGTVLLFIGMALHLWSKGNLHQNKIITQTGPYGWVRHPFYLANAAVDLGLCLIINRIEVTLIYFFVWFIAYSRAISREEQRLETVFGEKFREYKLKVPGFVPWRLPASGVRRGFSWQNHNIAHGSEIPRLLRLAGYPLLFVSASELRALGTDFFTELGVGFVALWSFVFLSCASFTLKRKLKKQKLAMPHWITEDSARNIFVLLLLGCAFLFPSPEVEMNYAEFVFAAALSVALFLLVFIARRTLDAAPALATLVEGVILILICFLAEMPWLGFVPMSYYSALWVNGGTGETTAAPYSFIPPFTIPWLRLQTILTAGVCLMVWKESFDDLRGFFLTLF